MKTDSKNLTRSPALVFFLLMGIRDAYTLSILLPRVAFDWSMMASVLVTAASFLLAAALFLRKPPLLYVPLVLYGIVPVVSTVLKCAELLTAGTVFPTDILIHLLYLFQMILYGSLAWMVFRFGKCSKVWFLPMILFLVHYLCYQLHLNLLMGEFGNLLSIFFRLAYSLPAYGFLGHWLAYPYRRSYYHTNKNSNTTTEEETDNA